MKKTVTIILSLALATSVFSCAKQSSGNAKTVSAEKVQTLLQQPDNVLLIDVRTPKEFKEGHIENAQNIDFLAPTFQDNIKKLNIEKPIIVYCRSGRRSAKSTKILQEAGFTEIYDLQGGIIKWEQEGFKVKN